MKRKCKKEEGNRKRRQQGRGGAEGGGREREEQTFQVPWKATTLPKQLDPLGRCLAPLPCFMSQPFV